MKTLIIIVHPDIERSVINKRWIEELSKHPDKYDVHQLHKVYPDEQIDALAEQKLIEQYDKIVFQFPFYWFNCPPFLKKWLDDVLTYGGRMEARAVIRFRARKSLWRCLLE